MKEAIRLLIIGYVWPEPDASAAGSHMMQLIEQFQLQQWHITFASPAQPGENRADLASRGIAEQRIAVNDSRFDDWVKALDPDMVMFDRFMMEEQFGWRVAEQCPHALRLLDSIDLHSLRDTRQQLFKSSLENNRDHAGYVLPDELMSPEELYKQMASQDITQRELAAFYRCDLTILLSGFEMDLLTGPFKMPEYLLCYCPFMLDIPDHKSWPAFNERKDFVTIGNFLHAPNWDAVLWLKQSIWPLIRKRLPDANLFIYGAYTPQKALDLHNPGQGFHVLGWVEDAMQAMQQARVCLAPLRFGAGIKGKLADAMLCGTPSVTTSIGAEGMGLSMEVHDSAESIAQAAIELYTNEIHWQQAQDHGREVIRHYFDKQKTGDALISKIKACRNQLDQHRLHNFTGLLLQHHQHQSKKYMARWIESKNKNLV